MNEIFELLFQARDYTHFIHLKERRLGRHIALGEFYEELTPLMDELIELYLADSKELEIPSSINLPVGVEVTAYIKTIAAALNKLGKDIDRLDVQDVVAEIVKLCYHTLYKLSLDQAYVEKNND